MAKRAIVKDWQPIDSAPEARIIQVVAPGDTTPSLAIRRGNRWVWFPGEVPCQAVYTHWMDVWRPGE